MITKTTNDVRRFRSRGLLNIFYFILRDEPREGGTDAILLHGGRHVPAQTLLFACSQEAQR